MLLNIEKTKNFAAYEFYKETYSREVKKGKLVKYSWVI